MERPYERARLVRTIWMALLIVALALATVPAHAKPKRSRRRYVLPVAQRWAPKHKLDNRHHDYPAVDLAIPRGKSVRSVTAGRVKDITRWGGCGNGVIVKGADGFEYTYCHGSKVMTRKRRWVKPGQRIMLSGSSGHSTGPHVHLQIQGPNGRLLCPQPLLERWAAGKQVSPVTTSSRGCAYGPDRAIYRPKAPTKSRRGPKGRTAHRAQRPASAKRDRGGHAKSRKGERPKGRDDERKGSRKDGRRKAKDGRRSDKRRPQRATGGTRQRHAKAERRAAQRRRRALERRRAERLETARRRAELALDRRVQPLI